MLQGNDMLLQVLEHLIQKIQESKVTVEVLSQENQKLKNMMVNLSFNMASSRTPITPLTPMTPMTSHIPKETRITNDKTYSEEQIIHTLAMEKILRPRSSSETTHVPKSNKDVQRRKSFTVRPRKPQRTLSSEKILRPRANSIVQHNNLPISGTENDLLCYGEDQVFESYVSGTEYSPVTSPVVNQFTNPIVTQMPISKIWNQEKRSKS
jgi:hemin uptake protein HemP